MRLDLAEYEAVRSHPARFLIVRGHEYGYSTVVAECDSYAVVEKHGVARRVAVETDPRSGGE